MELLELVHEFAERAKHQPVMPLPNSREQMKALGIETYEEFKARTGSTDGKECLMKNWGKWLRACTPTLDRDYMSTADLRHLDEKLLNRIKKVHRAKEYHTFIPSLPMLNEQIIEQISKEEKRELYRKLSLLYRHEPAS